jgi:aminoglycoside phosphotransferase (APT) family kinase protein
MNFVQEFLVSNWQRLSLERIGDSDSISSVMLTPRFRSSSNVLFAFLAGGKLEPSLIVKVPRIPGDHDRLQREADNLEKAHAAWNGASDSLPTLVAYEEYAGSQLLVETAQSGQKLSSLLRGGSSQIYVAAVVQWLTEFHQATRAPQGENGDWYRHLVEEPLRHLEESLDLSAGEQRLVEQTRELILPLEESEIPLVFEHGDLGPPNILFADGERPGVVDWELALPEGLPAVDLFFFLTLVGFTESGAKSNGEYVSAFRGTFFGQTPWARPHVRRYAESMGLSTESLRALFIVCWCRYVAGLVLRLHDSDDSAGMLDSVTAQWLRSNRYFSLWRHSVEHFSDLNIG